MCSLFPTDFFHRKGVLHVLQLDGSFGTAVDAGERKQHQLGLEAVMAKVNDLNVGGYG